MNNRLERVMKALKKAGLSQMLVTDPHSIRYLTGVDIEPGERFLGLLLSEKAPKLIINRLFSTSVKDYEIVWYSDTDDLAGKISQLCDGERTLGVDKQMPARFLLPLRDRLPHSRMTLASECVDWVRGVKDETERELMRMNSRINDEVMLRTKAFICEGMTEKQVAEYLTAQYYDLGCESVSFDPIVSFGANAADPHHMPDNTVLRRGDCIVVDIGGKKQGYCSDMTRTFACKEASEELRRVHELVVRANETAESVIKPGMRLCDIDKAARDVITDAGYGEYFTHRLGHFIGTEVHEYGDASAAFTKEVEEGMIFSCEPGVYLLGNLGVRIEDLVLVTRDGCEVLNRVEKKLEIVG
ncbi:MAG: aminopeptidase P family protein [Oscillospiraceae bacterium]|nr:aminopeptidase P family protein [Oscillospiraceae bacterium]